MSTEELVESYMYAWMMVQFHILGYTQLYAKYARHIINVPYRKFNDMLFEKIQQDYENRLKLEKKLDSITDLNIVVGKRVSEELILNGIGNEFKNQIIYFSKYFILKLLMEKCMNSFLEPYDNSTGGMVKPAIYSMLSILTFSSLMEGILAG